MTKDELLVELARLNSIFVSGLIGLKEFEQMQTRAVSIFTGDIVPVDWSAVARYTQVTVHGKAGVFISTTNKDDYVLVLMNDMDQVAKAFVDNVELVA